MSSSAYWNSQYRYYMNNQPPKAESYYNKDFVKKINEAQRNIDRLVKEKDKSWAASNQAKSDYKAFHGSMSDYNEVYTQSKSEFGIEEHRDNYEKSKKALALAESTLSALPSSINSSSNRVLTQSQREQRYNALADKQVSYRDNLLARSSAYEDVWKQARQNQADYAKAEMATQWDKLGVYNNTWVNSLNEYYDAEKRLTESRMEKSDWESDYRIWQFNQWNNAQTVWFNNMNAALSRYIEALDTESAMRQAEITRMKSDIRVTLGKIKNSMADTLVAYHWYQQAGK